MLVEDVFKIKRGTIIEVKDSFMSPAIGEEYSCGQDSWRVIGVERVSSKHFPDYSFNASYYLLISPVNDSEDPIRGYLLDKVDDKRTSK